MTEPVAVVQSQPSPALLEVENRAVTGGIPALVELAVGKGAADAALGPVIAQNNSALDLFGIRERGNGLVLCRERAGKSTGDDAGAGHVEKLSSIHRSPVE